MMFSYNPTDFALAIGLSLLGSLDFFNSSANIVEICRRLKYIMAATSS